MINSLIQLKKEIKQAANPQKAKHLMRFFKTEKGEYGEGDIFLGIMVPKSRELAKKYADLDIKQLGELIKSKYHEERLLALFILVNKYKKTNHKKICFHFYIKNMKYINNWDLVDLSTPNIVGEHLLLLDSTRSLSDSSEPGGDTLKTSDNKSNSTVDNTSRDISWKILKNTLREGSRPIDSLKLLIKSENVWERRIGVLATFRFIKVGKFTESLKLAEMLINDRHDLMHKAVGWMLREIGKRDQKTEIEFLNKYYRKMPRTMLRYSIEKFPKDLRQSYMLGKL
jgi:3-methyladenine DNA glycosylase AlkD